MTTEIAERPESRTRNVVVEQKVAVKPETETHEPSPRWKRILVDALLVVVVVVCVAELAIRLFHR